MPEKNAPRDRGTNGWNAAGAIDSGTQMVTPPLSDEGPDQHAEQELLQAAGAYQPQWCLADLDAERMRDVVRQRGVDFATALLFDRVRRCDDFAATIDAIDHFRDAPAAPQLGPRGERDAEVLVGIVPGFLYREYPASGADGRMLMQAAGQLGWEVQRVPIASTGRLHDNARLILDWLLTRAGRPVILASVSKGGSDIAAALSHDDAAAAFRDVIGWVNVCGIIRGSPVVDHVSKQWWPMIGFRLLFALRRWCFASVMDLRHQDGPLQRPLAPVGRMQIVHVVGFPLEQHFVHPRLRAFHRLLSTAGPNDGAIMLLDTLRSPGVVYPVWGADHYMRPRYRTQPLCVGLLRYLAQPATREVYCA
jgi:hypothetical protein